LCAGSANGSIDLTAAGGAGPYSYLWSTGDTIEDLANLGAGTYIVTVVDANQCSKSDTATLTEPAPIAVSLTSTVHNGGYNVSVYQGTNGDISTTVSGGTAPYAYFWTNGATDQNLVGLTAGNYTVEVTDSSGCKAIATIKLTEPFEFAMPGGISPNGDGFNDVFVIHGLDIFADNSLKVFNRWGDEVYAVSEYKNDWGGINKNGDLLPDGTYFVILKVKTATDEEKTLTGYVDIRK
jgi:gliding motility-associated-like protein